MPCCSGLSTCSDGEGPEKQGLEEQTGQLVWVETLELADSSGRVLVWTRAPRSSPSNRSAERRRRPSEAALTLVKATGFEWPGRSARTRCELLRSGSRPTRALRNGNAGRASEIPDKPTCSFRACSRDGPVRRLTGRDTRSSRRSALLHRSDDAGWRGISSDRYRAGRRRTLIAIRYSSGRALSAGHSSSPAGRTRSAERAVASSVAVHPRGGGLMAGTLLVTI
jgi:hypothetical protein